MTGDPREVLTRASPPPPSQIRYGDAPDQVADVWPGPAERPLVIFIHGGFWRSEYDRVHARPVCHDLAGSGYGVVSIEFARTGDDHGAARHGGWPATFDDVRQVVLEQAAAHPAGVVLSGHSAGGHLALWAAAELAACGR